MLFLTRTVVPLVLTIGLTVFVGIVGMNLDSRATIWLDLTD